MRNFLLVLVVVFLFLGCSKENSTAVEKGMTGKVYGKDWSASTCQASWLEKSFSIVGVDLHGNSIVFTLNDTIVKDYKLISITSVTQSAAAYTPKDSVTYGNILGLDAGGTVSITEINKKDSTISGHYSLTLYRASLKNIGSTEKVTLTDGVFSHIPYTRNLVSNPDNSFSSTIAGSSWSAITINGMKAMGKIVLNATDGVKTIGLTIPSTVVAGTYNLTSFGTYMVTYIASSTSNFTSSSGTVTITLHNTTTKRIEGYFTSTVADLLNPASTKTVTGTFAVTY